MKIFLSFLILISCCYEINAQNLSNRGKEFWVGYGHNSLFDNVNGFPNAQEMVLYLGATQPATVVVSINGTTYSQTYNIAANSVIQTSNIPKAGTDDPRLVAEGLNARGIHIVSDVPIVAYAHQYGLNSSGATMLMPVETYGYTYYSLNYNQLTNVAVPCYSWFYIIASENNTKVEITPSVTTNSGKPANVPFSVNLNKGEIYNVFGQSTTGSGTGLDVTGSKIKSIAGTDGKCHPIAVFSGSSRITICGSSGDILQQQIFPSSAWGTNYLTYPTIRSDSIDKPNLNYYRIAVRDPATKVKRNGILLTGLIKGFYYEYSSKGGDFIEANRPVLVSQYVPSMQNCNVYTGNGDPEMFFLSPLQQAVNRASFYNTGNQNILDNYVCIIVKDTNPNGISLDGFPVFDVFIPHPQNPNYSIAIKKVFSNQQHDIVSDSAFNAITYGFGQFESYGYNAGTNINNLDIIPGIKNTFSIFPKSEFACPKSPFNISIQIAYKATKIVWKFSQVPKLTPNLDTTMFNPAITDSIVIDGRVYYRYKLPNNYVFSDTGTYNIPFSVTAPEIDNCNNTLDFNYPVIVKPIPNLSFTINYSSCLADTANFLTTGISGVPIKSFQWLFDDGTTSTVTNPIKVFSTTGIHPVKLSVFSYDGCIQDTIKNAVTSIKPLATFGVTGLPACEGATLTFSDTSSFGGKIGYWYWDFGNGQKLKVFTNANQTSTYPNAGSYTVKHIAHSTGSCLSDTARKVITIFAKPQVKFGAQNGCLSDSTVRFTDSTTISDAQVLNYSWNFGDPNATVANPNTSTIKNPQHKYIVSGTYTVKLTVTTPNGCSNSLTKTVTVFPKPSVSFTVNASGQCLKGNSFTFTNTSVISGGTITYSWSFGDGTKSVVPNPTYSYLSAGVYNVKLVATSNNGCKDSVVKVVTVSPMPVAGFNINKAIQCFSNNNFGFTGTSSVSSGTLSYSWDFGDGGTSVLLSPIHAYSNSGTFNVKLVVTSDKGCKDSITKVVTVVPMPAASFTINNPTQCLSGNNFVFTNTSTISSGTLTYTWFFGDATTSALQNPSHNYNSPGNYIVKLVITGSNGCKDSISKPVNVLPWPTVLFSVNNMSQCITGNSFSFTNGSSTSSGTMTYQWFFGDGGNSVLQNPIHSYVSPGNYSVKLIVTTSNGCKDSLTKLVVVNPKPVPAFSINNPVQCLGNNSLVFTNSSTVGSGTPAYQWLFGDGGSSTLQNPTYTYTSSGIFAVKLVVTSSQGCKDSTTKTVTINPKPLPAFVINNPAQCLTGNAFVFTNSSSISAGTLTQQWTFGDGGSSNTINASHNYLSPGSYPVKLVVTSNNGCKDSITQIIVVGPRPVASFNINNASQCIGNNFSFTGTSSVSTGTITYQWFFGDGGNAAGQNVVHSYGAAGSYNVLLVVTSDKGCKDSISKTVVVHPKPSVSFTINTSSQCLTGNNFVFTNTSSIPTGTLNFQWFFGDGGNAIGQNSSHGYVAPGSYMVRLVATSINGCTDSSKQTVVVNPKPFPGFTVNIPSQCLGGNSFVFTNNSTVSTGTLTSQWAFGDGGNSVAQNPAYSYAAAGLYPVKLIVTSDKGCKDSIVKNVSVITKPTAGFSINNASQCFAGNSFLFINSSTSTFGALTYQWFFGDGGIANVQNPIHAYTTPGVYNVKLIVTAGGGCQDSIVKVVTVNPKPSVSFIINSATQCFKANNFVFTNTSNISSGTVSYFWTFGDGSNSTAQSPNHAYASPGQFTVKLVLTSDKGCKDSATQLVNVNPSPTASFTVNTAQQCINGNSFVFTNTSTVSTGSLTYQWTFGDGGVSSSQSPSYTYLTFGTYPVKLVISSSNGCKDSVTNTMVVYPKPSVSFNISNAAQCLKGNSFLFTNTSTVASGSITAYQWYFGDGNTSVLSNPVHSYAGNGSYQVKLVVTSSNGCKDSTIKGVVINPMPKALFSVNDSSQCYINNNFSFISSSIVVLPATYLWLFGDGDSAFIQNPSHSYLTSGTFNVKLVITSANGCKDSISRKMVVSPMPAALFNINSNNQCVNNNSFVFSNSSSIASGTLSYSWSFGDGNFSSAVSPTHSYIAAGTYQVKLLVTSDSSCQDSIIKSVIVVDKPKANFTINTINQCNTGNNFVFTNTSLFTGSPTFKWYFGDGGTSVLSSPSHIYSNPGNYSVKLIITNGAGCIDSISKNVTVFPQPTVAFNINSVNQCVNGNVFVFSNQSSVPGGTYNSIWSFGDGNTSAANNPTYTYSTPGNYSVKLLVISNNGCLDSLLKTVTVNPKPSVAFSVNAVNQCFSGNNFLFTNNSTVTGAPIYQWSFGDGGVSSLVNPSHNYLLAGSFTVRLKVFSGSGCVDSSSQTVNIYPKPSVSFTINNPAQCLNGNSFSFTNTSTLVSGSFTSIWYFGDGNTSNSLNAAYVYPSAGIYQVKLVVTSINGCKDSVTLPVTVHPKPTVSFVINNANQCFSGNNFAFTNTSLSVGVTTFNWSFGDGGSSVSQNPAYVYAVAGTYTVKLVLTSGSGCKDSTSQIITVFPKPSPAFSINNIAQCLTSNNFIFTNQSSISGGSFSSSWYFGDGISALQLNASHTYSLAGVYPVKLVVASSNGCKDSLTKSVTVNQPPVLSFSINDSTQCLKQNNFSFNNTSVVTGAASYRWQFGDGSISSAVSPSHTFVTAGTYVVSLMATSGAGCKDSILRNVYVHPNAVASFTVNPNAQCLRGNFFTFINASTISSGTLTSLWNYGDGGSSSQLNGSHSYSTAGPFSVRLISTSNFGCVDTAVKPISVYAMPLAGFNVNNTEQCQRNNNFLFGNVSIGPGALTYLWKFGNGNTSTALNPSYQYNASGPYSVSLEVTSAQGCADTITKPVIVHPQPVASFVVVANGQCANDNKFTFNNATTISSGSFNNQWLFGDGGTSQTASPNYTYLAAGTYPVKLIAVSNKGCRDTSSQSIIVKPKPVVAFSINKPNQCVNTNNYIFTNTSTGTSPVSHQWNFGDGTGASILQNATYTYLADGNYIVKLLVVADGCKDSLSKTISVYPKPTVDFSVNNVVQCLNGNNFSFTNKSAINSGTLLYNWVFGDGTSSAQLNPVHSFTTANPYKVKLMAISNVGCQDSAIKDVTVLLNPKAAFAVNNSNQCLDVNNFVFTNNSIAPSGTSYTWSFGDGSSSSLFSPSKVYTNAMAYKVSLFLSSYGSCSSDTATTSVSVIPNPIVNAGPDLVVQDGKSVMINAQVSNGIAFKWTPGTYLSSEGVQKPMVTPRQNIGYRLSVTGINGCTGYDSVYVRILKPLNIPNVFSPNGDGVNDTWVIKFLADYPGCTVEVFNRYGLQVFSSNGYSKPWDGSFKGSPLPVGTYYYIINPYNGLEKVTGYVAILR